MMKWLVLVTAIELLPGTLAAQKAAPCDAGAATNLAAPYVPGGAPITAAISGAASGVAATQENGDTGRAIPPRRIVPACAGDIATTTVAERVQRGGLRGSWLPGGVIPPARLSSKVMKTIEAWNGQPVYLVAVSAPGGSGHVRVVVDAVKGKVLETQASSWDWGNAPAWWQQGLSSPPPPRR